jgi:predicted ATPase
MATAAESEPTTPPEGRAKPPFLRRVRIRNYKSIAFCDVTLEPLTVLVGRNGSGKSNFLDALAFVRDALATNLTEATQKHGGWPSILCRSVPADEVSFELDLDVGNPWPDPGAGTVVEYGFAISQGPFGPPMIRREWFRVPAGPHFDRTGQPSPAGTSVAYVWTFDHPDIPYSRVLPPRPDRSWLDSFPESPFDDVVRALRLLTLYNFDPRPVRQPQQSVPGTLLESDGRNLAGVIRDVGRIDPDTVERVGQFLSVIVPEVERFEAVPVAGYDTIKFHLRRGESRPLIEFDAASMSDGTLRALAALVAVYQVHRPSGPSVVGIEEPETALHPAAANALVGALDEATLSTQVIVTTHSPDLLDHPAIRPENVRVVQMVDGRTVIGTVDEASREIVKDGLNTLGGLERDDSLGIDLDDLDRQAELSRNGRGPHE